MEKFKFDKEDVARGIGNLMMLLWEHQKLALHLQEQLEEYTEEQTSEPEITQ